MVKTIFAAWLLRITGAVVEYRVQRIKAGGGDTVTHIHKDGTTVLRSAKYRDAMAKYKSLRVSDTDTVILRMVGTVKQRHGTVVSKTEKEV